MAPENLDDLWHLKYVIEPGDLVRAVTRRTMDSATDKIRPEKTEKKPVLLTVRAESIEFARFANRLRVLGVIEEGTDMGHHHTINVEEGTEITVIKEWKPDQLKRLKEAREAAKRPKVVIVTVEEGEAAIGLVREYGVEEFSTVKQGLGKGEGGFRSEFFGEVLSHLENAARDAPAVILAGPGFTKQDFYKFIKDRDQELAERVTTVDTSSIGVSGFQEVLRRGAVDRVAEQTRITREARLIERLMEEIAGDGKAAYGMEEVGKAIEYGAVDTLLVADETLREARIEEKDVDSLLRRVEHAQGSVVVFSTEFEPGQRLEKLGGIAALLRFPIN